MSTPVPGLEHPLNPTQRATHDGLLAVGGERPYAQPGLAEELGERIRVGTEPALRRWTEPSLWLSKAQLFSVMQCEGKFAAGRERQQPSVPLHPSTAVGLVAHRAIQLAFTHPQVPVSQLVEHAITGARREEKFEQFWSVADVSSQSDLIVATTSRVMGFLDSWPPLHPSWSPRFEEALQAKVGRLTLSGRVDLLMGRPRPDGRQTMLVADWKTGGLDDNHTLEASFYALLATLRFGVPPFRSVVYSLASGAWTDPDVDADRLRATADRVAAAVTAMVEVLTESRPPTLTPSRACGWCPLASSCPASGDLPLAG